MGRKDVMYKNYENPYEIDCMLQQARIDYLLEKDEDAKIFLAERISDLEERLNFAWQDEEYDCEVVY